MSGPGSGPAVVIGIGNEFRRDDGAGSAVIGQLRGRVPCVRLVVTDGEPTRLIDAWTGAALAVVVDASGSSGPSRRTRARSTVLLWIARAPKRAGQPARTASASTRRSPWPWPWTGCPGG